MKHHRRSIAVLRWMSSGAIAMGLMGGLGRTGMEAGAVASVMRVSQQQLAQASSGRAAFDEGMRLYQEQTAESLRAAIIKFEEALKMFRAAKNRSQEAATLNNIGSIYDALEERQKELVQRG